MIDFPRSGPSDVEALPTSARCSTSMGIDTFVRRTRAVGSKLLRRAVAIDAGVLFDQAIKDEYPGAVVWDETSKTSRLFGLPYRVDAAVPSKLANVWIKPT